MIEIVRDKEDVEGEAERAAKDPGPISLYCTIVYIQ